MANPRMAYKSGKISSRDLDSTRKLEPITYLDVTVGVGLSFVSRPILLGSDCMVTDSYFVFYGRSLSCCWRSVQSSSCSALGFYIS